VLAVRRGRGPAPRRAPRSPRSSGAGRPRPSARRTADGRRSASRDDFGSREPVVFGVFLVVVGLGGFASQPRRDRRLGHVHHRRLGGERRGGRPRAVRVLAGVRGAVRREVARRESPQRFGSSPTVGSFFGVR